MLTELFLSLVDARLIIVVLTVVVLTLAAATTTAQIFQVSLALLFRHLTWRLSCLLLGLYASAGLASARRRRQVVALRGQLCYQLGRKVLRQLQL